MVSQFSLEEHDTTDGSGQGTGPIGQRLSPAEERRRERVRLIEHTIEITLGAFNRSFFLHPSHACLIGPFLLCSPSSHAFSFNRVCILACVALSVLYYASWRSRNTKQAICYCALISLHLLMLAHVFTDLVRTHTQTARKQNCR